MTTKLLNEMLTSVLQIEASAMEARGTINSILIAAPSEGNLQRLERLDTLVRRIMRDADHLHLQQRELWEQTVPGHPATRASGHGGGGGGRGGGKGGR
jgi:hypothetical protein